MVDEQSVELVVDVGDGNHADLALHAAEGELVEESVRACGRRTTAGPAPSSSCAAATARSQADLLGVHEQVEIG